MEHIAAIQFKELLDKGLTPEQAKSVCEQIFPELTPVKPQRYIRTHKLTSGKGGMHYYPTVAGLPYLIVKEDTSGDLYHTVADLNETKLQPDQVAILLKWMETHHGILNLEANAPAK